MSLSCPTVKIEPLDYCTAENEDNLDDAIYSKEALDLSIKNTRNSEICETIQTPDTPEIHTEFVSIKTEVNLEESIKEEPSSDADDCPLSKWYPPEVNMEPDCVQNQNGFLQIEIKRETTSDDTDGTDSESQPLSVHRRLQLVAKENEDALNLNAVDDGKYMCPICQKRFATKGSALRHRVLHSREKLECQICSRTFLNKAHLEKHIQSHTNKTYECPECGKSFNSTSNLGQHRRTHLDVKPFKCDVCQRQFTVKANFLKHQGKSRCKAPSVEPLICHVCNKVFARQYLLQSHLKKHTTERPFSCERCDMHFKYKSTLMRHVQLHNGIKPFACSVCSKTFTHAGLIKPHMRKHTGEKPYPCPVCTKLFAHKHNMERHMQRHAKPKHLDCHICLKRFPKESRLRYHMRIHTNEKPFPCAHCSKRFSHKQNAIRHYTRKHPGRVYDYPATDASVARAVWEAALRNGTCDVAVGGSRGEYVLP